MVDAGPGGIIMRAPDKLPMLPVQKWAKWSKFAGEGTSTGVVGEISTNWGGQVPEDESG